MNFNSSTYFNNIRSTQHKNI